MKQVDYFSGLAVLILVSTQLAQWQGVECRTKRLLGSMPSTADLT